MRRILIVLTLIVLVGVAIAFGVIVADWPHWSRVLGIR
jgi:hypothetical protein